MASSSAPVGPGRGPRPWAAGLASGVLLWFAFPPADWGWLGWVALVPLFRLIASPRPRLGLYFGAWLGGLSFWLLAIAWIRLTDDSAWLAWVVMATVLSLWWPAFLGLTRLAVLRFRVPALLAAPTIWVGLEYARAHILSGFPWYYLAHSQHRFTPVIQIADCTGALGVSWLLALVNAWGAELLAGPSPTGPRWTRAEARRGAIVLGVVAATLGYGAFRIATARFRPGPRVALLQSSLIQKLKMESKHQAIEALFKRLIDRAAAATPRPDLIVWPETSYPYYGLGTIDPRTTPAELERQVKELDPETNVAFWRDRVEQLRSHLQGWTDEAKVALLVGASYHEFGPTGHSKFNSALLFEPGGRGLQSYHKLHLVPFGEYVPLIDQFPWLTMLTPYHGTHVPSLSFGREPRWFTSGPYRFAAAICFEDTVPHVVRRFFHEAPDGRQPDVLLNLSNDGWFHGSSELDMHLAVSVFRAVENRVPLARAVNTGVSALIDGNGRVLDALPKLKEDVLIGTVPLDDRASLYSSWGDWLGTTCLALTLGLVPWAIVSAVATRSHRRPA